MNKYKVLGLLVLYIFLFQKASYCQYKSIDAGIFAASIGDDYADTEYEYDSETGVSLSQFQIGYTFSIGNKFTLSPRFAMCFSYSQFWKRQLMLTGGTLADRTFIEKRNRGYYVKGGIALTYWVHKPGNGFFVESEFKNFTHLSSKSKVMKRVGAEAIQESIVDISEDMKGNVPSLRIGVGYSLKIKRVSLFIKVSRDLRIWTYFKTTDNYTLLNKSGGLGIRYIFQTEEKEEVGLN